MAEDVILKISIERFELIHILFGNLDEYVKRIEKAFRVTLNAREGFIIIKGQAHQAKSAEKVIQLLSESLEYGEHIDEQKINYCIQSVGKEDEKALHALNKSFICITARGKYIKPKTVGQQTYIEMIAKKDVVFGVGPAGTGKTYLAVAMAVKAFKNNEVNRIVVTRPAVEAGENLGFLPGDLQMKVDPYLRPIYDALYDILGSESFLTLKEKGMIEIAPLAYMRGRTLDDAFIILDEAQNTTKEQMKMFLTRLGYGSKVVVNGDITQIDLPRGKLSGLKHALDVLKGVDEIGYVFFSAKDVVRHELVKKMIACYDRYEQSLKEEGKDEIQKKTSRIQ